MRARLLLQALLLAVLLLAEQARSARLLVRSMFSALHLPNLTAHMNSTLHGALHGLPFPFRRTGLAGGNGDLSTAELLQVIPASELNATLEEALLIASKSAEEIKQAGWKVVHKSDLFSLYKRRSLPNNQGPVEYMMTGKIADVSPRTFLHVQISCECRRAWDKTVKEMTPGGLRLIDGAEGSEDSLYYRTKWPWPLKDRDYTLARRCRAFEDKRALVFVSRSADMPKHERKEGVIRVDNYWCHSALFSTPELATGSAAAGAGAAGAGAGSAGQGGGGHGKRQSLAERAKAREASKKAAAGGGFFAKLANKKPATGAGGQDGGVASSSCLDKKGLTFVSIFCDDQKVPLHPRIVDMIAHQVRSPPAIILSVVTPSFRFPSFPPNVNVSLPHTHSQTSTG